MNKYTPKGKGIRTGLQALVGSAVTLVIGLALVIWNTPGVPENVANYLYQNLVQIVVSVGVPTGVLSGFVAWYQNRSEAKHGL